MKLENSKFAILCEDVLNRYQTGGLLSGDFVKFRKGALNNPAFKDLDSTFKEMIKEMMESDLNLKVGAVKTSRPVSQYNMNNTIYGYSVDIVQEYAPGLYKNPMTVPMEVLERVDTGANLAPIPDSLRRKDRENFTPEPAPVRKQDGPGGAPGKTVDKTRNLTEAYESMYKEDGALPEVPYKENHHMYADELSIHKDFELAKKHNTGLTPEDYVDNASSGLELSAHDERILNTWLMHKQEENDIDNPSVNEDPGYYGEEPHLSNNPDYDKGKPMSRNNWPNGKKDYDSARGL